MELSEYLKQIVNDDQWVYENDCDLSARGITPDIVDEKLLFIVVPNERTSGSVRVNISQVTEKGRKMENRSQR